MYSLVLMSALTTGGDTASFGWRGGCYGGSCSGVVVAGCCGGTVAAPVGCCGGYAAAPASCCGGCGGRSSLFPLFPGLRSRLTSRVGSGCCGGYVASSCYGSSCYGSSCHGSSCHGSAVYYGTSCYGSAPAVGLGCTGSYYAPTLGYGFAGLPTYSLGGCYGTGVTSPYLGADFSNSPSIAYGAPIQTGVVSYAAPVMQPIDARPPVVDFVASRATPTLTGPARLTIELPADAVLFVDGEKIVGTGTVRNFHTPNLPEGTFFYDLKAQVKVDGETVTETARVLVKAGDAKTETFGKLIAAVKTGKPSIVSK